ncbi:hypothetical protein [Sediminicoccus rosea]|uniref:Uncharacterized protein n=1 Tax=Sediminicoccus rosea TaxID=1225128 RepID=A0ABZ0PMF0_9PROT|nr:hypothetical protein [Sediminicoccus rosea]WPB86636.1 hypothetical protein R9Z33_07090 [Sediminicoccus rosea]
MIYATSAEAAAPTRFSRVAPEGGLLWRTDYFGPPPSPKGSSSVDPKAMGALDYTPPAPGETRPPQAFLVEQEVNAVVHPHFHFVDQFQVVVEGGGAIGRHAVQPIMAHFAGASTGYGPITPDEGGLKYFTLRASADGTGAQFLPASKARMSRGPKRYVLADPVLPSTAEALAARREAVTEMVLGEPDGLAILMLRIPPHGRLSAPDPARGAGQSMLVTTGSIRHEGQVMGRLSALFVPPDEAAFLAEAGPEGAEILLLQYPRTTP